MMMTGALAAKYRSAPMLHYMAGRDRQDRQDRQDYPRDRQDYPRDRQDRQDISQADSPGTAASLAAQARRDRVTTAAAETAVAVAKK